MSTPRPGQVVAAFGRQYLVEIEEGATLLCFPRGKKSRLACGDLVAVEATEARQGVVTRMEPRRTLLHRSDAYKQKLIAANATQIAVVVGVEPAFDTELISRCIVAAEHQRLRIRIVLNKVDLIRKLSWAREALADFRRLGYPIVEVCATQGAESLRPFLSGELSVLVGQSGMGKSTLINALLPGAAAATRVISTALDSGRHTTTHSRLYRLDAGTALIDSPGLQEFGLAHLSRDEIEAAFVEFRAYRFRCRFRNCRHDAEPDCALRQAVEEGTVSRQRARHFQSISRLAP